MPLTFPKGPLGTSNLTSVCSLGALPPSSFLWSTYASEGYFHTLRLRYSYLTKKGEWDLRYTPMPRRFYGKDPKRSTTFLNQCHQSHHPLSFPLQKKAFRLRRNQAMKDQATTQPFNDSRTIIRQKSNSNAS